ncbi:MAG: Uma2 family endonuclease [Bryobacterales bacterium]|nr:Uma2 family endonuclease [Bryobacterales bacterium]
MTDDDFAAICADHPDLSFEMTAEGEIIIMAPAYSFTAARNAKICAALYNWAEQDGQGITFDSSAGFVLPNGARRSPVACWLLASRVAPEDRKGFLHLCPDFVIELRSDTDRLATLQRKLQEYMANGARLGWLLDPEAKAVEIYRPDGSSERIAGATRVEGEGPVAGFVLELARVWNPLSK